MNNDIKWLKKYLDSEIRAVRQAVDKAQTSMERRLDGMNEFRKTISDNNATFVTRKELWAAVVTIISLVIGVMAIFFN